MSTFNISFVKKYKKKSVIFSVEKMTFLVLCLLPPNILKVYFHQEIKKIQNKKMMNEILHEVFKVEIY